jgi:hypothetical protein
MAYDAGGNLYVANWSAGTVMRFTPTGEKAVFVRGLATPAGLSFDARSRLLISNRRTHQILAALPDGSIEVVAEGLQTPVGAVELPAGDLLVSNIAGGIALVSGGVGARPGWRPGGGDVGCQRRVPDPPAMTP